MHEMELRLSASDPDAGYGALVEAAALLDETDRRVVRVRGPQARRMVNGLVSNHLDPLNHGRAVYSFVLTPKGRPVAELRILPAGDELWMDTPRECLEALLSHLGRYLPPIYARFELHPRARRLAVVGPKSAAALARAADELGWESELDPEGLEPLELRGPHGEAELPFLVRREPLEGPGFDVYLDVEDVEPAGRVLTEAAVAEGGGASGRAAWEILRVERGVPVYGAEIDLDVLPQETGQEGRAINFEKGCYTGQEVVARIHYRGKVNRLLRGLRFRALETAAESSGATPGTSEALPDASEPLPSAGTELHREGRAVGRVTTAVRSPRHGPIALAYVRREVEPGERLTVAEDGTAEGGRGSAAPGRWSAEVVALPFTSE